MDPNGPCSPGHYGALGVHPSASPRQIELAFRDWGERFSGGSVSRAEYRRAECAYHVLAVPAARRHHDRQLGLLPHPAWKEDRDRAARDYLRLALRELGGGNPDRALLFLERAVSLDPREPQARSCLALALARTGGSLHEAARHGRYALDHRPHEPSFLFNLAEVYDVAGLRMRALAMRARGWRALVSSLFRPR